MKSFEKYELECRYDTRQSFYGKAFVEVCEDDYGKTIDLLSYGTNVARISFKYGSGDILYEHFGKYSQTTSRHQKEFFRQYGLSMKEYETLRKNGELLIKGE